MKKTNKVTTFLADESGEFGIKQIAITVAVIVLIGFIVTTLKGQLPTWINDIWSMLVEMIEEMIN